MQFDPLVRANFPQMTLSRFSHRGQSPLPDDIFLRVCTITRRLIDAKFGLDIGLDVLRINFEAAATEMKTTVNEGCMNFSLNMILPGMETATLESVSKFTQRDGAIFVELKLPYGKRQFIFNPVPFTLPARLTRNPENNHVIVEFAFTTAPKNTKFYMCFGELETYRCTHCGTCKEKMRKCAKCKDSKLSVRYCSKECQLAHWPAHKAFCGK